MAKKVKRPVVDDPRLEEAVKDLVLASDGFRRAYETWSLAPDNEVGWERRMLEEAQARLDSARDKIHEVEFGDRARRR